jgi:gamma-glutamyltranspeptidase/glutathione hydrolase
MQIAVATPSQYSIDAALDMTASGGNAVDSALAALFVDLVVNPGVVSPGAGAFLTIEPVEGDAITIDGYCAMPGLGHDVNRPVSTRVASLEYGGGITTVVGHGSVAVPGVYAAAQIAWQRFGTVPWRRLFDACIAVADRGYRVPEPSAYYFQYSHLDIYGWHPESYATLHDEDGGVREVLRHEHLAETLERLGDKGADDFYTGETANAVLAEMDEHNGLMTEQDLATYQAVVREPIHVKVGDWQIATNPAPAVGGAAMAAMCRIAETNQAWDSVEQMAEIQATVLGYRNSLPGLDLDAEVMEFLNRSANGLHALREAPSTVQLSAVDAEGLAISITASAGYGSGLMVPGTGMWMNNCLGEIELSPRGLFSVPAGHRLMSNMAPTVAKGPSGEVLAIGSPGASRITTALMQVLGRYTSAGVELADAVAAPRFHVDADADVPTFVHEPGIQPPAGYPNRSFEGINMYFGGVQAASRDLDGTLHAVADARRASAAAVT